MKSAVLANIAMCLCISLLNAFAIASPSATPVTDAALVSTQTNAKALAHPMITPPQPIINAKGFVLMDAQSGDILASKNMNIRMQPASLTKMMTLYITSANLAAGRIHLDDLVKVSHNAFSMGGSRMFLKEHSKVRVEDLMRGIIVDSGNDACTAIAEYLAGNEATFAQIMNQTAKQLGMKDSHFVDSTGLPRPEHYATPHDIAILARALITHFPQYYPFYKQKWLTFNGIKQPNRNRLLWRDARFDGVKTGHTKEAGYCLVASGKEKDMRLIAIIMGAPTDMARANDSEALLNYGFRFYKTHQLYDSKQPISQARVWFGEQKTVPVGVTNNLFITIPIGSYNQLKALMTLTPNIKAPIIQGQTLGALTVTLNGKTLLNKPLIALNNDPRGGVWTVSTDHIAKMWHALFN